MSGLPKFTIKELMDAGVHYGHKTMRWDPRMAPYIYGESNGIHIINLQKTAPFLYRALEVVRDVAASNGRILFVGTKRQASTIVKEAAERTGQYYVNHRWLGGMMTNWPTVSQSIQKMRDIQGKLDDPELNIAKKERLQMERKLEKLSLTLDGIKDMGSVPNLLVVFDINEEHLAVKEANVLGIPVVAITDTNVNPAPVDYIVPGNDDAIRSIQLYCDLFAEAALSGIKSSIKKSDVDAGEAAEIKAPAEGKKPAAKKAAAKKDTADEAPAAKAEETAEEPKKAAAS